MLSEMGDFTIAYDVATVASSGSQFNTAFDLWFTRDNPPTPEHVTTEVMIWTDRRNWLSSLPSRRVRVDGQDYDLRVAQRDWLYIAFEKAKLTQHGTIHIKPFIDFLLENDYIAGSDYLADIEFGTELVHGSGLTVVNAYSVDPGAATGPSNLAGTGRRP